MNCYLKTLTPLLLTCMLLSPASAEELDWQEEPPAWQVAAHPKYVLVRGILSLEGPTQKLTVKEHVGGGGSQSGEQEPQVLKLNHVRDDKYLHLRMIQEYDDGRKAALTCKTRIPKSTGFRARTTNEYNGLTNTYQILWQGMFEAEGNIIKHVYYVARLAPKPEGSESVSFDRHEVKKAMKVINDLAKEAEEHE